MIEFSEKQSELQAIKKKCERKGEESLAFYCDCLIKMCRAYNKINQTDMLFYVKQIMAPAFPRVIDYFINQVTAYIRETKERQKAEMKQDIEESVVEFIEVFEEIIHSTNGADRMLFQSAPIDMGIRYVAPKLCAYYSGILNSLSEIFSNTDAGGYAFCVYPTQTSAAQAVLLFATIEKRGKVCIIRIPRYKTAHIQYLRQLLCHEFFHVQPGNLRLRRERANIFVKIMLYSISKELCKGCDLSGDEKEKLKKFFFLETEMEVKHNLEPKESEDRIFYSREISDMFVNLLHKNLYVLQRKGFKEYFNCLNSCKQWTSYEEYHMTIEKAKDICRAVQENIKNLLFRSKLTEICKFYMDLFRESYADIMAIITLRLSAYEYFLGFQYFPENREDYYQRSSLYFRVLFVAETMSADYCEMCNEQKKLFSEWKLWKNCATMPKTDKFVNNIECLSKEYASKAKQTPYVADKELSENSSMEQNTDDIMVVNLDTEMKKLYMIYFHDCCQKYLYYENSNSQQFHNFRSRFNISFKQDDDELNYTVSMRHWEEST